MEEEKSDAIIDRISQLPEPILQHILSFLVVKEAFRTSVVSKSWNNACATLPFLNFGGRRFFPNRKIDEDQEIFLQKLINLLNVVDGIVLRMKQNNVGIQKFCLELPSHDTRLASYLERYVNKFISSITEGKDIKELVFKVGNYVGQLWEYFYLPGYTLPEVVYAAESIIKLDLEGFMLGSPSTGTIKFHSLRELYLSWIHVDNDLFRLLMMGCPQLEILCGDHIKGLNQIQVFGSSKLKRIRMYNCHRNLSVIKIDAPNLENLCHHGLGILFLVDVFSCKNLKHLLLHSIIISDEWMADLLSNLLFLEEFHLTNCWGLKTFSISSNLLKGLSLLSCKDLLEIQVNAPCLRYFGYSGNVSLSILLTALVTVDLYFTTISKTIDSHWQDKMIKLLGNFNHSKAMRLICRNNAAELIIPGKLRETLHPPLYDIRHLTVGFYKGENNPMLLDLLDSLLWIAPGLDKITILCHCPPMKTVQFTHMTSTDEDEDPSCTSIHSKRGLHTLKKVKFENFEDVEDHWRLRNYFVKNAKILQDIEGLSLP